MNDHTSTKSFDIPKSWVWQAYLKVKSNKGSAGADGVDLDVFEEKVGPNLYKIWNRLSSGSYMPPPVLQVEIPKASGDGVRILGIPSISDRVAQTVVKQYLEPILDPVFHQDSYGYRPGKSAKQAVAVTRSRCWKHDWVVEFDIKGAFDNIDHGLLLKALEHHVSERWVLLYVKRWLEAPFVDKHGSLTTRSMGTPQGSVIGPLLLNLFMHNAFDKWMDRESPECPFARYADDAVIHCHSRREAEQLLRSVAERLGECGLELHPAKSKVVYCKDSNRHGVYENMQFVFLGFCFRPRCAPSRSGKAFTSFLPAICDEAKKSIRQSIRRWCLQGLSTFSLEELADRYNPIIRGWINYYGAFYKQELGRVFRHLDSKLVLWVQRKFKQFRRRRLCAKRWLVLSLASQPNLFVHWKDFSAKGV
jgi:RNA-directed DNA polymerase